MHDQRLLCDLQDVLTLQGKRPEVRSRVVDSARARIYLSVRVFSLIRVRVFSLTRTSQIKRER